MKSNLIVSLVALVIGGLLGVLIFRNYPTLADSNRIQHYITMLMLLIVSLLLLAKNKENQNLKEEIKSLKS